MKYLLRIALVAAMMMGTAYGQRVETLETCSVCKKPINKCEYKGKHPKKQSTSLQVNGSSSNTIKFCNNPQGCNYTIDVKTNAKDYTYTTNRYWIKLSDKTKTSFRMTIGASDLTETREGYVLVKAGDKEVRINVSQAGVPIQRVSYLKIDGQVGDRIYSCSSAEGCTAEFNIATDTSDYAIYGLPDWAHLTTKGLTRFVVDIDKNERTEARSDYFYVKAGTKQVKVTLTQIGGERRHRKERLLSDMDLEWSVGVGLNVTGSPVSFGDDAMGQVINYGVNDLSAETYTEPDYSSGVGFEIHGDVNLPLKNNFYIQTGASLSFHNFSNQFHSSNWNYNSGSQVVDCTQNSKEKYHFTYFNIPILVLYAHEMSNMRLMFKAGPVIGIGLSGRLKMESQINNDFYSTSGVRESYAISDVTGDINLFTGEYEIEQQYTTGNANLYTYSGSTFNPFKRLNMMLRLGVDLEVSDFIFGISYHIELSNLANSQYFNNVNAQVAGFYVVGEPSFLSSTLPLTDYAQGISTVMVSVGYRF